MGWRSAKRRIQLKLRKTDARKQIKEGRYAVCKGDLVVAGFDAIEEAERYISQHGWRDHLEYGQFRIVDREQDEDL